MIDHAASRAGRAVGWYIPTVEKKFLSRDAIKSANITLFVVGDSKEKER